jgi:signal transduction histidine kinase
MAHAVKNDTDVRYDDILLDAQRELDELRGEIDKYGIVFDSARLIVGHEFIKPLTSIRGYIELLEEGLAEASDDRDRQYFRKIREAIGHLEDLVEAFVRMLRFDSRIERIQGQERMNIRHLVDAVRGRFEGDAHRIENAVDDDIPELYLQRSCIEVVLENLISNAIKNSTDPSPIRVEAALRRERRRTSNKYLLMVRVEDRGVGIPEHEIKDVFNPFYRVGGTNDTCGLGLGLSLVKGIITIMRGEIHIKSALGKGTTVTFSVPIPDDQQVPPETVG